MNFSCDGWTDRMTAHPMYLVVGGDSVLSVRGWFGEEASFSFRSILPEIGPTFLVRPMAAFLERFTFRMERLYDIAWSVGFRVMRLAARPLRRSLRTPIRAKIARIRHAVTILRL